MLLYHFLPPLALLVACGGGGTAGEAGTAGTSGSDGQQGASGQNGADGADGANGQDGADGADGADGVDGADGRDGVDASATYHWADATGADVTTGTVAVRFDASGYMWSITSGPVGILGPSGDTAVIYSNATCSGSGYIMGGMYGTTVLVYPRVPIRIDGAYYVLPDSPTYVNGASADWFAYSGSSCVDVSSSYAGTSASSALSDGSTFQFVAVSTMTPIAAPPAADWTGPLHPVEGTGSP